MKQFNLGPGANRQDQQTYATKHCPNCDQTKALHHFSRKLERRQNVCKPCALVQRQFYRELNRGVYASRPISEQTFDRGNNQQKPTTGRP